MGSLRLVFMGSAGFSVPTLRALLEAGHQVVAVYTQPPRPAGRGHRQRLSPIHAFAAERGLEVWTPASLKGAEAQRAFAALSTDAALALTPVLVLGSTAAAIVIFRVDPAETLLLRWPALPDVAMAVPLAPDSAWLHGIAFAIAFFIITLMHMTLGEQAPKVWALKRPELSTMRSAVNRAGCLSTAWHRYPSSGSATSSAIHCVSWDSRHRRRCSSSGSCRT